MNPYNAPKTAAPWSVDGDFDCDGAGEDRVYSWEVDLNSVYTIIAFWMRVDWIGEIKSKIDIRFLVF